MIPMDDAAEIAKSSGLTLTEAKAIAETATDHDHARRLAAEFTPADDIAERVLASDADPPQHYRDPLDRPGEVERLLGYHPATTETAPRHAAVRDAAIGCAHVFIAQAPGSQERSNAITALREAMMWANAAIAVHAGGPRARRPGTPARDRQARPRRRRGQLTAWSR